MVNRQSFKVQGSTLNVALCTSHEGFTTAELLVAALFGMIVIGTLYGFYRDQLFQLLAQETKTATLEDARGALDMMVRDLRNAGSWGTGTQPTGCARVAQATSTTIQVQMDTRGASDGSAPDGDCNDSGEDVIYALSGTSITRGGATHPLVSNVVATSLFTYYKSDNSSFTPANTAADRDLIKRVKITFSVQVPEPTPEGKAAGRNITSTLTSSVEFRN